MPTDKTPSQIDSGCLGDLPVIDSDDQQTRDVTYLADVADTNRTLFEQRWH